MSGARRKGWDKQFFVTRGFGLSRFLAGRGFQKQWAMSTAPQLQSDHMKTVRVTREDWQAELPRAMKKPLRDPQEGVFVSAGHMPADLDMRNIVERKGKHPAGACRYFGFLLFFGASAERLAAGACRCVGFWLFLL